MPAGRIRARDSFTRRAIEHEGMWVAMSCVEERRVKRVDSGVGCHTLCVRCKRPRRAAVGGNKDHHLGSGVGARRGKRNHSMGLGTVRRLTSRIWTNTRTAGPLGVNPVQAKNPGQTTERDRCRRLRRLKKQGAERRRRSAETERQRLASLDRERELIADDDAHHGANQCAARLAA